MNYKLSENNSKLTFNLIIFKSSIFLRQSIANSGDIKMKLTCEQGEWNNSPHTLRFIDGLQ